MWAVNWASVLDTQVVAKVSTCSVYLLCLFKMATKKIFFNLVCVCILLILCYICFIQSTKPAAITTSHNHDKNMPGYRVPHKGEDKPLQQNYIWPNSTTLSAAITTSHNHDKNMPGYRVPHKGEDKPLQQNYIWPNSTTLSIEEKVEKCMREANLVSGPLLTKARGNARYFLDEYRKVIPEKGLKGHRSHCWKGHYTAKWDSNHVFGKMGNISYLTKLTYYPFGQGLPVQTGLAKSFKTPQYSYNVLCLPNVYILGYTKCGSTFFYSFLSKLIILSTGTSKEMEYSKETQYWAHFEAYLYPWKKHMPNVTTLGMYLLNYIPGIEAVRHNNTDAILIEGTPNTIVEWPIFSVEENNMTNYCLLPAALPTLFPDSKYFAIVRNPLDMLYSNFWFSCTKRHYRVPDPFKGPDVFHDRVMSKIDRFNNCVRDTSDPGLSAPCSLDDSYSKCIRQRTHLLDQCSDDIIDNEFTPELPSRCGEVTIYYGIYYIHVRKWLSLVRRDRLFVLTLEELNRFPGKIVNDTLHFLDLKPLTDKEVAKFAKDVMKTGDKYMQQVINYKSDPKLFMRADTRLALETFYHPFNALLAELLSSNEFLWF